MVKNPPANAGDIRDRESIPGLGRSPEEGHGNPLQFSYLENPMDRGTWGLQSIGSQGSDTIYQLTTTHRVQSSCIPDVIGLS